MAEVKNDLPPGRKQLYAAKRRHDIQMLEWALEVTKDSKGDLLELYCGNGEFFFSAGAQF